MGTTRRQFLAFAALAVLLGPVSITLTPIAAGSLANHSLAAEALASFVAGLTLSLVSRRRTPAPRSAARAIWLLLLPHLVSLVLDTHLLPFTAVREPQWGTAVVLRIAAPLFLALLAAVGLAPIEVPRTAAAAAIAGLTTVLFAVPTNLYLPGTHQLPMVLVRAAVELLTVWTWVVASSRLRGMGAADAASRLLLLRATVDAFFSVALERTSLRAVVWHDALLWLALSAIVTAAASWLWFRLLLELPLPGFSMHPLAVWTTQLFGGIALFGPRHWEIDLAATIGLAAVAAGLTSRPERDQPLALELGSPPPAP